MTPNMMLDTRCYMSQMDFEGALDLLGAIGAQWAKDCRKEPDELPELAAWLELELSELGRRLAGRPALAPVIGGAWRTCPACGQALPHHNASETGKGRRRLYCDDKCRVRYAARRKDKGNER